MIPNNNMMMLMMIITTLIIIPMYTIITAKNVKRWVIYNTYNNENDDDNYDNSDYDNIISWYLYDRIDFLVLIVAIKK